MSTRTVDVAYSDAWILWQLQQGQIAQTDGIGVDATCVLRWLRTEPEQAGGGE